MTPFDQLMKPPECGLCGRPHWPDRPHDPTTLEYQSWFEQAFGRRPIWSDALAHCDELTKALAKQVWEAYGIDPTEPVDLAWPQPKKL